LSFDFFHLKHHQLIVMMVVQRNASSMGWGLRPDCQNFVFLALLWFYFANCFPLLSFEQPVNQIN